jgi:hypothetical protein
LAQTHKGVTEPAIVTIGDSVSANVRAIEGPITAANIIRNVRGE